MVTTIPLAIALCIAPLAQSVSGSPPRLITVSGSGEVRVPPDEIVITLGVETSSLQLMTARAENDDRINAMKKAAASRGVRPEHLKTDYLNIEPRYRDEHRATGFIGYFVRRTLVITVRDVGTFETLLSDVLQAGATHVHDIEFHTTELRRHRDAAREMAIKAAREKAEALARQLGQQVGVPHNITESGGWVLDDIRHMGKPVDRRDEPELHAVGAKRGADGLCAGPRPHLSHRAGDGQLRAAVSAVRPSKSARGLVYRGGALSTCKD